MKRFDPNTGYLVKRNYIILVGLLFLFGTSCKSYQELEIHAINRWGTDAESPSIDSYIEIGSLDRSEKVLASFSYCKGCPRDSVFIYFIEKRKDSTKLFESFITNLQIDTLNKTSISSQRILVKKKVNGITKDSFLVDSHLRLIYNGKSYFIKDKTIEYILANFPNNIRESWKN